MRGSRVGRRPLLQAASLSLAGLALGCDEPEYGVMYDPGTRAYPSRASVAPGETLTLHVSTPAPQFRIEIYRRGLSLERVYESDWLPGVDAPIGRPDQAWEFPGYDVPIASDARSGVYLARLIEGENGAPRRKRSLAAQRHKAQALFVVRADPGRRSPILYKLADSTYHAYNFTGGGSLYHVARNGAGEPMFNLVQDSQHGTRPSGTKITLRRPGGGVGADTTEPDDFYDVRSIRNTFAHWDAHFIRWLEAQNYPVDYCLGIDVHRDSVELSSYSMLVCAGHDEYWSEPERNNVEAFLASGGNIAFFTGNTCWWRIHYVDDDTAIVCDKRGSSPPDQWYRFRPENALTGVSYRFGGGRWKGSRPTAGYTVQQPDHWAFAGTGLARGDVFGADPEQPLIGYECDSAPYRRGPDRVAVAADKAKFGTPDTFTILGLADLGLEWSTLRGHSATMGAYTAPSGGQVFNAATTDWVKLLDRDPHVAQITRNVLDRFSGAPSVG